MMDRHEPQGGHSAEEKGVFAAGMRYVGSIVRHLEALLGLAQMEAREAGSVYLRVAVYLIIGMVFLIFGYIFFILCLAFLLAGVFGLHWIWILTGLCIFHLALAGLCAWRIREGFRQRIFSATSAELRKDAAMLRGPSGGTESIPTHFQP